MKTLQPPIELAQSENEPRMEYILTVSPSFVKEEDFTEVSVVIIKPSVGNEWLRMYYHVIRCCEVVMHRVTDSLVVFIVTIVSPRFGNDL